jgi:hypothetical protein
MTSASACSTPPPTLEFKVNGQRALRIGYATSGSVSSPNLVGGFSDNIISNGFIGAVIGGGGSSIHPNRVGNDFAAVVGGLENTAIAARPLAPRYSPAAKALCFPQF